MFGNLADVRIVVYSRGDGTRRDDWHYPVYRRHARPYALAGVSFLRRRRLGRNSRRRVHTRRRAHIVQPPFDNVRRERDACGIGFLADASGRASRTIVDGLLEGLARMRHRGAVAADRRTGDGAGLLLPLPRILIPAAWCGLAMVFVRDDSARAALEEACAAEGLGVGGWREVPTVPGALGERAQATMPRIEQLVLLQPLGASIDEAEARAYRARHRAETADGLYIASMSFRTVTYKALCAADQLAAFYPDLRDPDLAVPFGIFHQRFATNSEPSWERAQPFRLLCHNGEINSIDGNVAWMRARG